MNLHKTKIVITTKYNASYYRLGNINCRFVFTDVTYFYFDIRKDSISLDKQKLNEHVRNNYQASQILRLNSRELLEMCKLNCVTNYKRIYKSFDEVTEFCHHRFA